MLNEVLVDLFDDEQVYLLEDFLMLFLCQGELEFVFLGILENFLGDELF